MIVVSESESATGTINAMNMANIPDPVTIDDLERYAATHLDKNAFGYYSAGSDDDVTLRENRQAFNR